MTTKEMIAEYNQLTGKNIKKFSSRAAGERQLEFARINPVPNAHKPEGLADEAKDKLKENIVKAKAKKAGKKAKVKTAKRPKVAKVKKPKVAKVKKTDAERSTAIRESWASRKTAASRSTKHHVAVAGHGEFKSVRAAFVELGLPIGQHIRFRGLVKRDGKAVMEHGSKTFAFKLVEKAA